MCLQLSEMLLNIQKGIVEDSWGWRWEVTDRDTIVSGKEQAKELQEAIVNVQAKTIQEVNGDEQAKEVKAVNGKEHATEVREVDGEKI